MKNKILVIGGTGTTGRSLIEKLKQNQADFKALVRSEEKARQFKDQGVVVKGEQFFKGIDGIHPFFCLFVIDPAMHPLYQNVFIMRAVEDLYHAPLGRPFVDSP